MLDILINRTGSPLYKEGGFIPATYSQFLEQKIYKALMSIPANIISGMILYDTESIESSILTYLSNYFMTSKHIDIAHLKLELKPKTGSDSFSTKIIYTGRDEQGNILDISNRLEYSMTSGRFTSVSFESAWIETYYENNVLDISHPVFIKDPTNLVEIPMLPSTDTKILDRVSVNSPIYLITENNFYNYKDKEIIDITIDIINDRHKYSISKEVYELFDIGILKTIDRYNILEVSENIEYTIFKEYNEDVIITTSNTDGFIKVRVSLLNVSQSTRDIIEENRLAISPLFPLRPYKGKFFASFPKSIRIGNYFLKYNAKTEEF